MAMDVTDRSGKWEGDVATASVPKRVSGCPFTTMSAAVRSLAGGGPRPVTRSGPRETASRMATMAYGLLAYAMFFGTILYAIGWVGNWFVPKSIDSGAAAGLGEALTVNTLLLLLFVVQHTVMARPAFKAWWMRYVPRSIERSTFVIAASSCLILTFFLWRPLPAPVWEVTHPSRGGCSPRCRSSAGDSSLHRRSWSATGTVRPAADVVPLPRRALPTRRLSACRVVQTGASPADGRLSHRVLVNAGHVAGPPVLCRHDNRLHFFGTWIEERDLIAEHGEDYLAYRRKVGALSRCRRRPEQYTSSKRRPARGRAICRAPRLARRGRRSHASRGERHCRPAEQE